MGLMEVIWIFLVSRVPNLFWVRSSEICAVDGKVKPVIWQITCVQIDLCQKLEGRDEVLSNSVIRAWKGQNIV
jgi:hypothetical protein